MALRCENGAVISSMVNAHVTGSAVNRKTAAMPPPVKAADRVSMKEEAGKLVSLGRPPAIEPDMSFNPFLNADQICSPYEVLKTVLMLPICLLRMVVFTLLLLLGLLFTKIALLGAKDVLTKPFPTWRRNLLLPVRFLARVLLFACGFHWITIKGRPAPRSQAPIIVCNHVTFVDPVFIFFMHLPVIVTAEENLKYPVMGAIISAMQVIAINRGSPDSRRVAAGEIKRRARCNDWSPVMIFPEATTTNGRSLVSFKTGAFAPGYPVQPMVVRYPHVHMDPAWVALGPSIYLLIFRLMTQLHNFMVVEYLPVIEPTKREEKNPRLFTERVRFTMAKRLNVNVTEHSFEDLMLVLDAQKKKDFTDNPILEFTKFDKMFKLTVKEAKHYYSKFRALDPQKTGQVRYEGFLTCLALPDCPTLRQVFSLFDTVERGYFNFRQYVNGLAYVSRLDKLKDTVDAAYRLCDQDQDGLLSFEDVSYSFKDLIPAITADQVKCMWERILAGGGGGGGRFVKKVEFVNYLEANPEYVAVFLLARDGESDGGSGGGGGGGDGGSGGGDSEYVTVSKKLF